jgi:hypothetical protein
LFLDWNLAKQFHGELAIDQYLLLAVGEEIESLINMIIFRMRADPFFIRKQDVRALCPIQVFKLFRPKVLKVKACPLVIDPAKIEICAVRGVTEGLIDHLLELDPIRLEEVLFGDL